MNLGLGGSTSSTCNPYNMYPMKYRPVEGKILMMPEMTENGAGCSKICALITNESDVSQYYWKSRRITER
jgi:hypothetical protein